MSLWVIGGGKLGIQPKLLPCTLVCTHVWALWTVKSATLNLDTIQTLAGILQSQLFFSEFCSDHLNALQACLPYLYRVHIKFVYEQHVVNANCWENHKYKTVMTPVVYECKVIQSALLCTVAGLRQVMSLSSHWSSALCLVAKLK